jgi:ferritin
MKKKLISDEMNAALNEQIGHEFGSSLEYVALATYFDSDNLPALAAHYYRQAEEERSHAMRIVKYVVEAGGCVEIPAIAKPRKDFQSAEEVAQFALDSEVELTKRINHLVELAIKEADYITHNFLQWFLAEQLEEVSVADTLLGIIRRAGEAHLLLVEEYLARQGALQKEPQQTLEVV